MGLKDVIQELKLEKQLTRIGALKKVIDAQMSIDDSLIRETQFWHVLCEFVDVISKVEVYVNKTKAARDDILIDLKNEAKEPYNKSDAARKRYAESQESYREARDDYNDAEALFSWVKNKSRNYEHAMFVIKDIRERQQNAQKFTPATEPV